MASKYRAVTTKGPLFGYEADLKLDKYAILNLKKSEKRADAMMLNENSLRFATLEEAVKEAELCVAEQGRKQYRFVVYGIRTDSMGDVQDWQMLAVCEKSAA